MSQLHAPSKPEGPGVHAILNGFALLSASVAGSLGAAGRDAPA